MIRNGLAAVFVEELRLLYCSYKYAIELVKKLNQHLKAFVDELLVLQAHYILQTRRKTPK